MKRRFAFIAVLATLSIPAVCSAVYEQPGAYVSGFVGVSVPRDTDVTTSNGTTFNDDVEFDPGVYVGGTGGVDFGLLRIEGELSYKRGEMETITENSGTRYTNVDGDLGAFAMMFNAFIDLHNYSPITPYLGGGAGFATLNLSDTFGNGPLGRTLLYYSDTDTVFAYQAGGGLEIHLNPMFSLDLGYRYFGTSEATFNRPDGGTTKLKYQSHNGAVGFRMKF
ncbi:MAG: porin family protein [Geobacter sp.]|nr:porin family protein [Geobacter sp.]